MNIYSIYMQHTCIWVCWLCHVLLIGCYTAVVSSGFVDRFAYASAMLLAHQSFVHVSAGTCYFIYLAPSCTHSWFHVQLGFVWNWCRPKSYGSLSVPLLQVPFALISHYLPLSPMFRQTKKWIDATLITNVCGDFETADVLDLMGINSMNQTLRAITLCWGIKPYSIHCSHSTILILIHIYI